MKPGHMHFLFGVPSFFLLREIYLVRMPTSEFAYFEQGDFASSLS